jgi:hypothetical protein
MWNGPSPRRLASVGVVPRGTQAGWACHASPAGVLRAHVEHGWLAGGLRNLGGGWVGRPARWCQPSDGLLTGLGCRDPPLVARCHQASGAGLDPSISPRRSTARGPAHRRNTANPGLMFHGNIALPAKRRLTRNRWTEIMPDGQACLMPRSEAGSFPAKAGVHAARMPRQPSLDDLRSSDVPKPLRDCADQPSRRRRRRHAPPPPPPPPRPPRRGLGRGSRRRSSGPCPGSSPSPTRGGVGKTTTAVNPAPAWPRSGIGPSSSIWILRATPAPAWGSTSVTSRPRCTTSC